MSNGVYFNGKWILHPGAYSTIDAQDMTVMNSSSERVVALIGTSKGGIPGQVMWFNDPVYARKVLKGGYLLKAAEKAWSPAKDGGGAYTIACIRANNATQSKLEIGDGVPVLSSISKVVKAVTNTSTGSITVTGNYTGTEDKTIEIIIDSKETKPLAEMTFGWRYKGDKWKQSKLTSAQGGQPVELVDGISVKFSEGNYNENSVWSFDVIAPKDSTIGGVITSRDYGAWTRRIQCKLEDGSLGNTKKFTTYYWADDSYEVIDNIGACFYLKYIGTQEYATVSIIANEDGQSIKLITKVGPNKEDAITDLEIDLTENRFSKIRDLADYLSGYENYVCRPYSVVNSGIKATQLDIISDVDITQEEYLFNATWRGLELELEQNSEFVSFKLNNSKCDLPENFEYTLLAGGSDGETPSSWLKYFDMLSAYDIQYIVPLTGDEAIQAEAKASVNNLSNNMGRERCLKIGGYNGESVEITKKKAMVNNDSRVQLAYPGFYDTNEYGELELYPPFITAAMYAGRDAFLGIGQSATFNYFDVVSLEKELTPSQINELLKAGVAPLECVINKGYRLVQDITTYTSNTKSLYTERSVRDLADDLNKRLRQKIEDEYISQKGIKIYIDSIKNTVISFLQQEILDERIVAYKGVAVSYLNRVLNIEYSAAPSEPINYALIRGHFYTSEQIVE